MTTLRDVALAAQVSTMTVSRAINNPSQVKPESLAKVRAAIQQLGYQTNRAAKALVTGSTGLIRLIAAEYLQQAEPYLHECLRNKVPSRSAVCDRPQQYIEGWQRVTTVRHTIPHLCLEP